MRAAVDLHIHTALSPCAAEDMTPNNIVNMAMLKGLFIEHSRNVSILKMLIAMSLGLVICYGIGATWLGFVLNLTVDKAIALGIGWYLPLDAVKIVLASMLGYEVRKALIKSNLLQVGLSGKI